MGFGILAGAAYAGPPQLHYLGTGKGIKAQVSLNSGGTYAEWFAGELNVERCDIVSGSFYTYCVNVVDDMDLTGNCWDVSLLGTNSLSPSGPEIGYLTNKYAPGINSSGTNAQARILQLVMWELLYETSSSLDLTAGSFQALNLDTTALSAADLSYASTLFTDVGSSVANYYQLNPSDPGNQPSQDLVNPVPEPGIVAAFLVGFGGLLRRKVRR